MSHDREFVSGLATRIIEILPDGELVDYRGGYEDYLAFRAASRRAGPARRAGFRPRRAYNDR